MTIAGLDALALVITGVSQAGWASVPPAFAPGASSARATSFALFEHTAAAPANRRIALDRTARTRARRVPNGARSGAHALVMAAEIRHGLPRGLLDALVEEESGYDTTAVSLRGAVGLAQLMPATALMLGVIDPRDPWMNVDGGGRYLRQLLDRFGSVALALAAYNAGPAIVVKMRGLPPYRATRRYVMRILTRWQKANDPGRLGRFGEPVLR